jgi:hypothetical protein
MTVSHHMLRRTARVKARKLDMADPAPFAYRVEKTKRGPWRWRVVRYPVVRVTG